MDNRIQNEIDKTLGAIDNGVDVQVSPAFMDNISSRIEKIGTPRAPGYKSPMFYPAVIALLVLFNVAVLLVSFTQAQPARDGAQSQISVLANEYGIGSETSLNF